jgi:hypothetical protein
MDVSMPFECVHCTLLQHCFLSVSPKRGDLVAYFQNGKSTSCNNKRNKMNGPCARKKVLHLCTTLVCWPDIHNKMWRERTLFKWRSDYGSLTASSQDQTYWYAAIKLVIFSKSTSFMQITSKKRFVKYFTDTCNFLLLKYADRSGRAV